MFSHNNIQYNDAQKTILCKNNVCSSVFKYVISTQIAKNKFKKLLQFFYRYIVEMLDTAPYYLFNLWVFRLMFYEYPDDMLKLFKICVDLEIKCLTVFNYLPF